MWLYEFCKCFTILQIVQEFWRALYIKRIEFEFEIVLMHMIGQILNIKHVIGRFEKKVSMSADFEHKTCDWSRYFFSK